MQSKGKIVANSIKLIHKDNLVKCRNIELSINEKVLPKSYDADDAVNEGFTSDLIMNYIEPDLSSSEKLEEGEPTSLTDIVVNLCSELKLFHSAERKSYCVLSIDDKNRVLEIQSYDFTLWLRRMVYRKLNKSIHSNLLKEVVAQLESKAIFDGELKEVAVRTTRLNGKIYVDLCNDDNQCIEISSDGYQILSSSPIAFIRRPEMISFPFPESGGNLEMLKNHIGTGMDDRLFKLVLGYILGALGGQEPYPILMLTGEQGSGKSTLSKKLRMLIDPSVAPLSFISTDEKDLAVSSHSSHMISIDNLTKITQSMSDMMCMLSTKGNYKTRKLHTNTEQVIIKLCNPLLLNGINYVPQYPDLLERSFLVELQPITSTERKTEKDMMDSFISDYPKMFGFICEILSKVIRELPNVRLAKKPRMADFCEFVTAAESTLGWEEGSFFEALESNQKELGELSIDDCAFVEALKLFIDHKQDKKWFGTMAELLRDLDRHFGQDHTYTRSSDWPKSNQRAGKLLSTFQPLLKRSGYKIRKDRKPDKSRTRFTYIEKIDI